MRHNETIQRGQKAIRQRVRAGAKARILRIDDKRGVLHWCGDQTDNIEREDIVLCYSGGNQFTAVRDDKQWVFFKGWFDTDPQDWRETQFVRADLLTMIKMATYKEPGVCYIPKSFCDPQIRNVVYNYHILGIQSTKNDNTGDWNFRLISKENKKGEMISPWLAGKPWESLAARGWCRLLPDNPPLPFKQFALETMQDAVEEDREELEQREDWGLF